MISYFGTVASWEVIVDPGVAQLRVRNCSAFVVVVVVSYEAAIANAIVLAVFVRSVDSVMTVDAVDYFVDSVAVATSAQAFWSAAPR